MPSILGVARLVFAVALVAAAFVVVPAPGAPEYDHYVTVEDSIPEKAESVDGAVFRGGDSLSPPARQVVTTAHERIGEAAESTTVVLRGTGAPEFFYSDTIALGQGEYYVEYEETVYQVWSSGGGSQILDYVVLGGLFSLASALATPVLSRAVGESKQALSLTTASLAAVLVFGIHVNTHSLASVLSVTALTVGSPALAGWAGVVADRNL
ncbi:hypothetical protein C5B91_08200 [Haloferax sp. Atlit-10N]|uniref:hypothetical protein n=1 Tax=unclassified Haloferax TaxID=2625095 RepID=UPI000E242B2D|nr:MULTISPECIES: hypothetical protein [unclassified Haloferax]RDZ45021.1 hypothetical protein C5B87_12770 [Haloferax sp. Atlit-16N]RDZ59202.1 hypothetical protein C5B91_08200 [Haloferax sp. Atlit-10N]